EALFVDPHFQYPLRHHQVLLGAGGGGGGGGGGGAPPAPVAAPAPLTPPSANAGYLHNPAPEYPALAMRRGWEGTVLLRVHVLASGSPSEIQVQKSSGREALDQAAVKAVKRWSFVPAKRGDKAEDGWVSVPIDFKLN
ncbi:energy transducer TonB, partial [Pseudomonas aeruginosa]|uniref:energy transducer TonB n=1 Tax=Pseudomonas aeruginosa TaxID=287 RepID=UPI0039A3B336